MNTKYIRKILILLFFLIVPLNGNAASENNAISEQQTVSDSRIAISELNVLLEKLQSNSHSDASRWESLAQEQRKTINRLEAELKYFANKPITNGSTYEVWTSVALTCATIALTVFGLVAAILGFYGYAEIKKLLERYVENNIQLATKEQLNTLIENGSLDAVIKEMMFEAMYLGVDRVLEDENSEIDDE